VELGADGEGDYSGKCRAEGAIVVADRRPTQEDDVSWTEGSKVRKYRIFKVHNT
jgi:hypothetical protein